MWKKLRDFQKIFSQFILKHLRKLKEKDHVSMLERDYMQKCGIKKLSILIITYRSNLINKTKIIKYIKTICKRFISLGFKVPRLFLSGFFAFYSYFKSSSYLVLRRHLFFYFVTWHRSADMSDLIALQ